MPPWYFLHCWAGMSPLKGPLYHQNPISSVEDLLYPFDKVDIEDCRIIGSDR